MNKTRSCLALSQSPVFVLDAPLPSDNQSQERRDQAKTKQKGHQRVMEKIKEIKQNFLKAVGKQ